MIKENFGTSMVTLTMDNGVTIKREARASTSTITELFIKDNG